MKKIALFILMLSLTGSVFAQRNGVAPLAKGEHQLNFGLGFNDYGGLPIFASFDFAVHKDVTVILVIMWICSLFKMHPLL